VLQGKQVQVVAQAMVQVKSGQSSPTNQEQALTDAGIEEALQETVQPFSRSLLSL